MARYDVGTVIDAEHPPHGGRWERVGPGKLKLVEATYPQAETPAEAAARAARENEAAALAVGSGQIPTEIPAQAAAEPSAAPRASKKKEG